MQNAKPQPSAAERARAWAEAAMAKAKAAGEEPKTYEELLLEHAGLSAKDLEDAPIGSLESLPPRSSPMNFEA